MSKKNHIGPRKFNFTQICWLFVLSSTIMLLYWKILDNPLSFDSAAMLSFEFLSNPIDLFPPTARALSHQTFNWIYQATGSGMTWQHLFNVIVHLATTLAIFYFHLVLFRTFRAKDSQQQDSSIFWPALFAAAFFGLSPIATYGIAYLAQRSIQMATFFGVICFTMFLHAMLSKKKMLYAAAALCYFLALTSKQNAIMLPAAVMALGIITGRELNMGYKAMAKELWGPLLLFTIIAVYFILPDTNLLMTAYEPVGQAIIILSEQHDSAAALIHTYPLSVLAQGWFFFRYLFLWIIPCPSLLSIDIHLPSPKGFLSWPETPGFLMFITLFCVWARLLFKATKETALLGFAMIAPMLLFITELSTARISEQFVLYRSYFWMTTLPAALPYLITQCRRFLPRIADCGLPLFGIYCLVMATLTHNRLKTFDTRSALWEDTISKVNEDETAIIKTYRTYNNYGHALTMEGKMDEAILAYQKSLRINPFYVKAHSNLGAVYTSQGKFDLAKMSFQKALKIDTGFVDALVGMGVIASEEKNYEESLDYYLQAIRLDPKNADAHYNTGNVYFKIGDTLNAEKMYFTALNLEPEFAEAHYNLALMYQKIKRPEDARKHYDVALKIKPDFLKARQALKDMKQRTQFESHD